MMDAEWTDIEKEGFFSGQLTEYTVKLYRRTCFQLFRWDRKNTGRPLMLLSSFTYFIIRTTIYVIFRKEVEAKGRLVNGEFDRWWEDSNPRAFGWNAMTLTVWSPPVCWHILPSYQPTDWRVLSISTRRGWSITSPKFAVHFIIYRWHIILSYTRGLIHSAGETEKGTQNDRRIFVT